MSFKRKLKYLGINLMKDGKYLYTKTIKTVAPEIKENLNKLRDTLCSGSKDSILLMCQFCIN